MQLFLLNNILQSLVPLYISVIFFTVWTVFKCIQNTKPQMPFLAKNYHFLSKFGPRDSNKGSMWPADENNYPPLP